MNNFRIGQKVVCVDDLASYGDLTGLQKGVIYTVRAIIPDFFHPFWGISRDCIKVREIIRPMADCPYLARRFRPLVERKTDTGMAMLTKILDGRVIEFVE